MATTELAKKNTQQQAPLALAEGWTREQVEVIKKTCAPDATDTELAMFLHVAKTAGLDPLQKQIHFSKRRANVGSKEHPKWEDRVTIMAGVDGLQARAERNPDFIGTAQAVVCAKDEISVEMDSGTDEVTRIHHTFNPFGDRGPVVGAWAVVKRKGKVPTVALVAFAEYNDERSPMWRGKPRVMIEKVARSTALRRAYPEAFSGLYDPAEMGDAAGEQLAASTPPPPAAKVETVTVTPEVIPPPSPPKADEAKGEAASEPPPPADEPPGDFEQEWGPEPTPEDVVAKWTRIINESIDLESLLPDIRMLGEDTRRALGPVYVQRREQLKKAGPGHAA